MRSTVLYYTNKLRKSCNGFECQLLANQKEQNSSWKNIILYLFFYQFLYVTSGHSDVFDLLNISFPPNPQK